MFFQRTHDGKGYKLMKAKSEISWIKSALWLYEADYDKMPSGNERTVWRTLLGENPRKTVCFTFQENRISKDGDLLDPWGTPYHLEFSDGKPHVRSAGPNKRFDDPRDKNSDDLFQ